MSVNARKQTSEQNAWQERKSYLRNLGRDPKSYDLEPDNAMKSKDWPSREHSPRKSGQKDSKRDSYDTSRGRRPGDVAKSYPVSPRNRGPGQQNHIRSPEGTWEHPRRRSRSRSRSRGRGRGRSRSPSRGKNRSRSLSRGRERDRDYGRSRSPLNDYRRNPHGGFNDRRGGDGRRGSQGRVLHLDNPNPRDRGRSERDQPDRWGTRGEIVGSRYDAHREEPARNNNPNVCNDFLKDRCRRGSSCRYSHDVGDKSQERQQEVAPCKFFMAGGCSRSNCRFAHDAPIQDDRRVVPRDDRQNHDYSAMNRTWNGPTWDEEEERNHQSVVKNRGWDGSTRDDMGGESGSRISTMKVKYDETDNDDERNHFDNESTGVDMDIAGSEAPKEIAKMEPQSSLDGMQYQTPYEISKRTSTDTHLAFSENSQSYSKKDRNTSMASGSDSDNSGNVYANVEQNTPMPGHDFIQQSDTYNLPPRQFGGIGLGQLVNSMNPYDEHNTEFNGPVEEKSSPLEVQNLIDTQHGHHVKPVVNHSMSQTIENKPDQISNTPSLTEKFVNEQLPQLYAVLNPPKLEESMASIPGSVNLLPSLSSINTQPDQTSIYQKRNGDGTEPKMLDNINQYPDFPSNSIKQNGGLRHNNHMGLQLSPQKMSPKPLSEEPSKQIAEKPNQEAENNGAGNVEADMKVEDGAIWKDEKAMRLFKNSLVEFVKDILKPKWKKGGMSKDVHKAIVKKVVDKVTSATQGVNIPSTQAKLDQYLQCSKPKLAKLVEAYVERHSKTS